MSKENIFEENELEVQTKKPVEEKMELNVFIKNKNTQSWWDDIILTSKNRQFKIFGCTLPVVDNYKLKHLIQSYHSFVEYHNMLVTTVNNKPLSYAYLDVVNYEDILLDAEKIEKDIAIFKTKLQLLELHIRETIIDYVTNGVILLEEKTITKSFFGIFANIFRLKKHSDKNNMVQFAVINNLVKY